MTISIDYEAKEVLSFDYKKLIEQVVLHCLAYEKCPYEVEVSIVLTDNTSIQEINCQYRGIDKPTDVLSFPSVEYSIPADFDALEAELDCFHPESGELLLGDIMISVERVISQAQEYGHSKERELGFLVAHSMLHLFGYDHMQDKEREQMETKQRKILEEIALLR